MTTEHDCKDELVCPYCGEECPIAQDSFEASNIEQHVVCDNCNRMFLATENVTEYTYSSRPLE